MKFQLTITDASPADLSRLLASLAGSTATVAMAPTPTPPVPPMPDTAAASNDDEDDNSGDTPVAAGTVDKDGIPWDGRIHSDPAKITSKGYWRKRRGVTDALVSQVEAELKARAAAPAQAPAAYTPPPPMFDAGTPTPQPQQPAYQPPPMPTGETFTVPASIAGTAQPVQLQVPPMPQTMPHAAPQPVQAPQPQQPAAPIIDFQSFMQQLTGKMALRDANGQPLIDANYLASVTQRISMAFGQTLSAITDISNNPQMVPYAVQIMQSEGRW